MRAVFLFNLSQFNTWRSVAQNGDHIFSTDVDVLAACFARKFSCSDLSESISETDLADERESATRLCDALGEGMQNVLPEPLQTLGSHFSHELLYPLGHFYQIAAMVDRALMQHRPDSILVFEEEKEVFFWDPPRIPPDLANGAARMTAEMRGISIQRVACADTNNVKAPPADQQHLWLPSFELDFIPGSVVAVGQGSWWSEMDGLMMRVSARHAHISSVSTAWMHYLAPRHERPDGEIIEWATRAAEAVSTRIATARHLLEQPVIRCLMMAWAGIIETALKYYVFGRHLCAALTPRVVIQGYDIRASQRCFAEAVRQYGAELISILHGGFNGMDHEGIRHRGAFGHLAVWSERDVNILRPFRDSSCQVRAIGSLREDVRAAVDRIASEPVSIAPRGFRKPRIVFLTCRISGLYWFTTSLQRHVAAWESVRSLFARRTDWEGIIKKHPRYDHVNLYDCNPLPENLRISQAALDATLDNADVAVMINLETTAVLDAISRGIPVIHVNTAARGDPDRWVRESGVITVRSIEAMEHEIDRLLVDDAYRREAVSRVRNSIWRFLSAVGDAAADRLFEWIDERADKAIRSSRDHDPDALYRLEFARWIDHIFLSDPHAPAPRRPTRLRDVDPDLPRHLFHRLTWYEWPMSPFSRAGALWRVYSNLPSNWRPRVQIFKRYLVECLKLDSQNTMRSPLKRLISNLLIALISPRSVLLVSR